MSVYTGYIGTGASGQDGGLRVVRADGETGTLRLAQHLGDFDSPSYLAVSKDKTLLLTGRANCGVTHPHKGMAATLRIHADGTLSPISATPSVSVGTCHVCFSADGRFAYCAHYGEGRVTVYQIEPDGSLWGPVQVVQHEGSGPHPQQNVPHVHYVCPTPDGKYLCCADLGLDVIRLYTPDENGLLTFVGDIPVVRGAGARHLVFSEDGRFCWVLSEMGGLLTSFAYHDGVFTPLQTVDLVEPGFSGRRWGSAVRLSPDGKMLFAGNRPDANTVAVFRVNADGTLTRTACVPCVFPRDLNILPNGKFLYVCGQQENVIQVFEVDQVAYTIRPTGEIFPAPTPTCIEFLR